jgi:hypothetical protein
VRVTILLPAMLAVLLGLGIAQADVLDWTLDAPLAFGPGGATVATGSLAFDADTNTASTWNFEISGPLVPGGISLTPATSTYLAGNPTGTNFVFFSDAKGGPSCGLLGCPAVALEFAGLTPPLSDRGGTVSFDSQLVLDGPSYTSFGTRGTASAVPEPSYLVSLTMALLALFTCLGARRLPGLICRVRGK